jgi:putative oxidoreductase
MTSTTATFESTARPGRGIVIALWVVQLLLAFMFGMAGFMKSTTPLPQLSQMLPWVNDVPGPLVRFIGISEFAGALGLILPAVTRIQPWLTPLAGAGLTTVMVLASGFHLSRGEPQVLPMNIVLGLLGAFVAWGRTKKAPISPR